MFILGKEQTSVFFLIFTLSFILPDKNTLVDIFNPPKNKKHITSVILWLKMSRLKKIRKERKLSQGQLAIKSKVSLRMIKAYEQRYRNINKASAETLIRLATALGCEIVDLLENDAMSRVDL